QQTAPLAIGGVRLGPDNKIYVAAQSTGYPYDSTNYYPENMSLSVINQPDRRGGAVPATFSLIAFISVAKRTYWGLPNNPDYDLGPVPGSICDSLSVQISEHLPETSFTLYPNRLSTKYICIFIAFNRKNHHQNFGYKRLPNLSGRNKFCG
ncbi:MAG: hypothetical protein IPL69_20855, partial [Saprospiraceae bacterium]|nr:hypothetical protein [Candidatus Brachybacter algidus]